MKTLLVPLLTLSLFIISGCSPDGSDRGAESEPSPEEMERRKAAAAKWLAEREMVKQRLISASDAELKSVLSLCRQAVEREAERRNKGPFAITLVNQYSADVYQFGAGSSAIRTDEERILSFRRFGHEYGVFDTKYAIISTHDSFSGPIRSIDKYRCDLGADLQIVSVMPWR